MQSGTSTEGHPSENLSLSQLWSLFANVLLVLSRYGLVGSGCGDQLRDVEELADRRGGELGKRRPISTSRPLDQVSSHQPRSRSHFRRRSVRRVVVERQPLAESLHRRQEERRSARSGPLR